MKGMGLARDYYAVCRPLLAESLPAIIMDQAAFGLAGEGSECFGLDDDISRDHDFGPAFCIWLPDALLAERRDEIENALLRLPREFRGWSCRMDGGSQRVGPAGICAYYRFFTGLDHPPANLQEWLGLPEERLAAAVNGEVFEDGAGEFSAWRKTLLDYYPEDVRLKKLAARVMTMAQAGQYNLPRSLERRDSPAALLAMARFAEAALSFVFLLNRQYKPYYKLAPRKVQGLPILGSEIHELLEGLGTQPPCAASQESIENFCAACAAELNRMELSSEKNAWLWAHGPAIARRIRDSGIRSRNLLED